MEARKSAAAARTAATLAAAAEARRRREERAAAVQAMTEKRVAELEARTAAFIHRRKVMSYDLGAW